MKANLMGGFVLNLRHGTLFLDDSSAYEPSDPEHESEWEGSLEVNLKRCSPKPGTSAFEAQHKCLTYYRDQVKELLEELDRELQELPINQVMDS